MNATTLSPPSTPNIDHQSRADKALARSASFWLVVTIIGQLAFFAYVAGFYGPSSLQGNFAEWAMNIRILKGYVAGDHTGNLFFAAHVLLAAVVILSGIFQLLPAIRQRAPQFHRWNGRLFMVTIIATSLAGLYLTWVRGTNPTLTTAIAISLDAVLIVVFAVFAWRAARARDFASHRKWALRTFIVVSAVWLQRLGYVAWIVINQGPVGISKNMDGPFDVFIAFGCYLVPLAVLELYFRAQQSVHAGLKIIAACTISIGTLLMAVGIAGASIFMWLPMLKKALA